MRIDKYLKISRIIKRRTVAQEACEGGKVEINGKTAKPSTEVKVGDIVTLTFGSKTLKIEVLSLKEVIKKEGEMPQGNASHDFLTKYNAVYGVPTDEKVIYLTFDAGFEAGYTPNILDVLKKHNAPATFFVVGNYLKTVPDLVKRMNDEGHIVGNHTYTHPDMSKI